MSTATKLEIISTDLNHTIKLGKVIGKALSGGEVIQLVSDLGGGKTTITKGIVAGAGCTDVVASPTFTISKEYTAPKFVIHHFDFYRLNNAGIVGLELQEAMNDSAAVTIIEWADIVADILPPKTITVNLETINETRRRVVCTIPNSYTALIKDIRVCI